MPSEKLIKIIKLLFYGIALTPIIITPMTIYPFNFGRGLIMQFLIEIIFGLYLALALFNKEYRPKKNIIVIFLAFFLGLLFISSFFGADFYKSFWSTPERFTGWFFLLHIFLFFIIISSVLRTGREWRKFLGFNALVSVAMFGIAILSLFGVKFWGVDLGTRISGTLGNPIFLAAYFILNLVFALYLFFTEDNKKYKIIWFFTAVTLIFGVFFTQSRGAFLGMLSGAVLGIIYFALHKSRNVKIIFLGAAAFLIIAAGSLIIFKDNKFIKNNSVLDRISDISIYSTTGNTRLMGWQIALLALKDRPFLGWGMENYQIAFNEYYNPEFLRYSYYETWFDKPHNKILEVAVDGGSVGVLLYLSIFGASIFLIRKKQKNGNLSLATSSVFLGGLVAYFIQNLFVFDTSASYLLFFVLLAFISSEEKASNEQKKIKFLYFLPFVVAAITAAWFINIPPFSASAYFRTSIANPSEDGKKINLSEYKRGILIFNPYSSDWRVDLAKNVTTSLRSKAANYTDEEMDYALSEMKKEVSIHPQDAYAHMLLGEFYAELVTKDRKYFDLAKIELDEALKLSPRRQHIYFGYGRLYGLMGDRENLIKVFNKAIELDPRAALSYWEGGKQLYFLNPDDVLAKEWLIKALEVGYVPGDNVEFLFIFQNTYQYFLESKNYQVLSSFYERMGEIEPREAKWHAQRAMAEYLLGEKEIAIAEIKKAIELDENYRTEGEKFLQMIDGQK